MNDKENKLREAAITFSIRPYSQHITHDELTELFEEFAKSKEVKEYHQGEVIEFALFVTNNYQKLFYKERRKYYYVPYGIAYVNGSDYHYAKVIKEHGKSIHELYQLFLNSKTTEG